MPSTPDTFSNYALSTVAGGNGGQGSALNAADTTLLLTSGDGAKFPATAPFMLLVGTLTGAYELVKATARTTDTCTIVRGQEGTTALTWAFGTPVQQVTTAGNLSNLWAKVRYLAYNVFDYGAVGDGTTDDGPAIRAACSAANTAGGGNVWLPGGHTYNVKPIVNPTDAAFSAAIFLYSNITLMGDGPDVSIIHLDASAGNQSMVVQNYHVSAVGGNDQHITIRDLTINGNSKNQATTVDRQRGIYLAYGRDFRVLNVNSKNCLGQSGSPNGPNGTLAEGHHIVVYQSTDVLIQGCHVYSDDTGKTASGIGTSSCTAARIIGCVAHDMQFGWGITTYDCSGLSVDSCNVYKCSEGIFAEIGTDVSFTNCTVGGTAPVQSAAYPFTTGQALGCTTNAFASRGTVNFRMTGCHAVGNQYGLLLQNETTPARNQSKTSIVGCRFDSNTGVGLWANNVNDVEVVGCTASNNTGSGFYIDSITAGWVTFTDCNAASNGAYGFECHGSTSPFVLLRDCQASGNTTNDVLENGAGYKIHGNLAAPTVPATTVAYTCAFATPVNVYITGGTVTAIAINGTATGLTAGMFRLKPGDTITLTYSAAPTWTWFAE